MSRQSVYAGLKTAIQYKRLPYHHFEDAYCTILFESWEQFDPFDHLLDSLPVPSDLKLNIYAEEVDGRTDGVAVTVSSDVQRLGYWQRERDMEYKVATFEGFLSRLFRIGCNPLAYDYEYFNVSLTRSDYAIIEEPFSNGDLINHKPLVSNAKGIKTIYLSYDW